MSETVRLVLSIVVCVICLVLFILVFIWTRKRTKYVLNVHNAISEKTKDYFLNIILKDDKYFPYHERVISGIRFNYKAKNVMDELTQIELIKHYSFVDERILYIGNNELHYPFNIVTIEGDKYIEIDDKLKTLEFLVSCEKPSHFLIRVDFEKKENGYACDIKEVKENE